VSSCDMNNSKSENNTSDDDTWTYIFCSQWGGDSSWRTNVMSNKNSKQQDGVRAWVNQNKVRVALSIYPVDND
jgi:hypothetical protein